MMNLRNGEHLQGNKCSKEREVVFAL